MGIGPVPVEYLRDLCAKLPKPFSVCELGDQLYRDKLGAKKLPCEPLYHSWGAGRYVSIDGNGKATILHDLNLPIEGVVPGPPFDLVTDFGTREHVFDQAQVWRTLHQLTKPGGYIAFETPHQGYLDHGMWNIQPNCIQALAKANGYNVDMMVFADLERGRLIRAVLHKGDHRPFVNPQQGRWKLQI